MNQNPLTRDRAASVLSGLFHHLGSKGVAPAPEGVDLGGMATQLEQFVAMPVELAQVFMGMATDLTELVLTSLEQAGIVLVEGLTPV